VQHASPEDMLFMQGRHPAIHSCILSVYSFTLVGSFASPCDAMSPVTGAPFLSYVREDDDFWSLARRLGAVTGDPDWAQYRLAFILRKTPFFIPRPSPQMGTAAKVGTHTSAHITTAKEKEKEERGSEDEMVVGAGGTVEGEDAAEDAEGAADYADAVGDDGAFIGPSLDPSSAAAGTANGSRGPPACPPPSAAAAAVVPGTVWSAFAERFPFFAAHASEGRYKLVKDLQARNPSVDLNGLMPHLGIQRSALEPVSKNRWVYVVLSFCTFCFYGEIDCFSFFVVHYLYTGPSDSAVEALRSVNILFVIFTSSIARSAVLVREQVFCN
jgi:hypothetical protein